MYEYDIDLDPSLLKDESTDGVFLTKVNYLPESNVIEARYHEYVKGEILGESYVTFKDNYQNYHNVLEQRYETLVKIIEIHDKNLYDKIENLRIKRDEKEVSYKKFRTLAFGSMVGTIGCGYAIANYDPDSIPLKVIMALSISLLVFGLYLRKESIVRKHIFDVDCQRVLDQIETNAKQYVRIKK